MAKNFQNAGSAKTFSDVAKASAEKAQVITVKMIADEKLIDYPYNQEDISYTADIERSIKEIGFIDPIEVTNFDQPNGMYMIVSGHRRRGAGKKCGITKFPCIIKSFNNAEEVRNYVLLANAQRDSSKDPLLFCRRYKMHEEYLKTTNFKGNIHEEIADRLGISRQHAYRYNTMNKVILPVWDMVRDEIVGMSSVLPMASHTTDEQVEILEMLNGCIDAGDTLTREMVKRIIDCYRDGKRTYASLIEDNSTLRDNALPHNELLNAVSGVSESSEVSEHNLINETDVDIISEKPPKDNKNNKVDDEDISNGDNDKGPLMNNKGNGADDDVVFNGVKDNKKPSIDKRVDDQVDSGRDSNDKKLVIDTESNDVNDQVVGGDINKKPILENESSDADDDDEVEAVSIESNDDENSPIYAQEKETKVANDIIKCLERLNTYLNKKHKFDNGEEAESAILVMASTLDLIVEEMSFISREYNKPDVFINALSNIRNIAKSL